MHANIRSSDPASIAAVAVCRHIELETRSSEKLVPLLFDCLLSLATTAYECLVDASLLLLDKLNSQLFRMSDILLLMLVNARSAWMLAIACKGSHCLSFAVSCGIVKALTLQSRFTTSSTRYARPLHFWLFFYDTRSRRCRSLGLSLG